MEFLEPYMAQWSETEADPIEVSDSGNEIIVEFDLTWEPFEVDREDSQYRELWEQSTPSRVTVMIDRNTHVAEVEESEEHFPS
jgi:hypothetical protein